MTILPVISRELRVQARLASTYGVRVAGVLVLLLVGVYFGLDHGFGSQSGGNLFSRLNLALFCSIWILVPLLAADCISREKREGTLGLLFLTPLRAREIVFAKGFVHGLRALTLWLAVLPVLVIPVLLGGVNGKEALLSVLVNFSCLCWALAAGLLGSAFGKAWVRSLLSACICGLLGFQAFVYLLGFCVVLLIESVRGRAPWAMYGAVPSEWTLGTGIFAAANVNQYWEVMFSMVPPNRHWQIMAGMWVIAAGSMLVLAAAILCAAWLVRRSWQEGPPSPRLTQLEQTFCTPIIAVSFLHGWMRRKLRRNPIGWLGQRTWSGRLVIWSWFAVMVGVYTLVFSGTLFMHGFLFMQTMLAQLLIGSLVASAAGSFRRERETGVMELLLVSPLTEGQIIEGRLRGLWGQFLPALVLLMAVWIYFTGFLDFGRDWPLMGFYLVCFATLPIVGLYFSLRLNNFLTAFLLTLCAGIVLPIALQRSVAFGAEVWDGYLYHDYRQVSWLLWSLNAVREQGFFITTAFQLLLAVAFGRRLYRDLARRNFSFDRSVL